MIEWGGAKDYWNIGNVLGTMGRYQEALDSHNKALKLCKELNDRVGMTSCYSQVGGIL